MMTACVIMHNMIIDSECAYPVHDPLSFDFQGPLVVVHHLLLADFAHFLAMHIEIDDKDIHHQFQNDQAEH